MINHLMLQLLKHTTEAHLALVSTAVLSEG